MTSIQFWQTKILYPIDCICAGVDREFERLLCDIFGADFIDSFKLKRPAGWIDLMIAFESRKRAANPWTNNALNVSLPFSFIDFHKREFVSRMFVSSVIVLNILILWAALKNHFRMLPKLFLKINVWSCHAELNTLE